MACFPKCCDPRAGPDALAGGRWPTLAAHCQTGNLHNRKGSDMSSGPTQDEIALFHEITSLTNKIWNLSRQVSGTIADPKFVSVVLFRRLRSNHKGYAVLWENGFQIEGEIIVRAAVETAICIAANSRMGDEFPRLMRRDAAATLLGQIKLYRDVEDIEMIKSSEAAVRYLQAGFREGEKALKLDWKSLAEAGGQPLLYNFHKMLSGLSSHVTGISLIRGIGDAEIEKMQAVLYGMSTRNYFNMIAGATLHGTLIHSGMIDDAGCAEEALSLVKRMDALSFDWPRAKD